MGELTPRPYPLKEERYTRADLVSFGSYLLSEEREKRIAESPIKRMVTDADIANWKDLVKGIPNQ